MIGFDLAQITNAQNGSNPKVGDALPPLNTAAQAMVANTLGGHGPRFDLDNETYIAGTLSPGAHPGGYNGQDAYNNTLIGFTPRRSGSHSGDLSDTLNSGNGGHGAPGVAGRSFVRRLTPTECERLQGFPDGWTDGQSDTQRYKQLGNAVSVPVIEWIGKRILKFDY